MDSLNSNDLPSRLLSLADELILAVIEQIQDLEALRNLTLTCKKVRGLAEPYVYKDIFIRTGRQAQRLRDVIAANPERALAVRHLDVKYKHDDELGMDCLNTMCRFFQNMKSWEIETPCPNDSPQQVFSGGMIQFWEHTQHLSWLQSSMFIPKYIIFSFTNNISSHTHPSPGRYFILRLGRRQRVDHL